MQCAKRIPTLVWVVVVGAGLAAGAWTWHGTWHRNAVTAAYAKGRKDLLEKAQFDTTLLAMFTKQRAAQQQRTDSVITVVKWRVAAVDSQAIVAAALARQLPPDIAALPEVVELKAAVFSVEASTRRLRDSIPQLIERAVLEERATQQLEVAAARAAVTAARLENITLTDSIAVLEKRPRWSTVRKVGAYAAGAGVVLGAALTKFVLTRSPR